MRKMILLSIHPKYADMIIAGHKKYEYRKIMPNEAISHIALYCTHPVQKVVAVVEVVGEISDTPSKLWEKTSKEGAITKEYFKQYFGNRETASAFKLGKVTLFEKPIALAELSVATSPQSFQYLSPNQANSILPR